jgi:dTDP-4-amino-4,6-dideoxygalactose transaminase
VPVICDSAEAMGAQYRGSGFRVQGSGPIGKVDEETRQDKDTEPRTRNPAPSALRHAGFDAWAAVYSFNGNKIITTSGGGMLASHDRALIDHARKLSTQARDPAPWYEHTEIGFNYRMSNIVAAIGRGQLQVLDQRVEQKRRIFEQYRERLAGLPGIAFMPETPGDRGNRWLTVILIDPALSSTNTGAVREALDRDNIEARPVWKPMHLQPVFGACRVRSAARGVETGREAVDRDARERPAASETLFAQGLCLPSGTAMQEADLDRVCDIVQGLCT